MQFVASREDREKKNGHRITKHTAANTEKDCVFMMINIFRNGANKYSSTSDMHCDREYRTHIESSWTWMWVWVWGGVFVLAVIIGYSTIVYQMR
jgi:hypothetical protein